MKSSERFKETIKAYLDKRTETDELFRMRYDATTRTIDDVVTYILNQVKASGYCGFSDDEIYSMAVHVIDEPDMGIGKPIDCNFVVNHHIELTEKEKAEQKALALKRFQEEEMRRLQTAHNKPKKVKPQPVNQQSLFDFEAL